MAVTRGLQASDRAKESVETKLAECLQKLEQTEVAALADSEKDDQETEELRSKVDWAS